MPASSHTLLRLVGRIEPEEPAVVRAIGINDWAWRKGHHYGTIVVDLERRKVVDLLADREADTVARRLVEQPEIKVISRDRSAAYADAAPRTPGASGSGSLAPAGKPRPDGSYRSGSTWTNPARSGPGSTQTSHRRTGVE
ncbi:transposase [Skermanella mucosa]|uniref:transposase n=1 Tax=Skermanella mucosa TaxID=1789672 RepID=UPI00192B2C1D|nr:transposase [Skermanella mucosa]UEM18701.1 transposase [Skermanella mucosa]